MKFKDLTYHLIDLLKGRKSFFMIFFIFLLNSEPVTDLVSVLMDTEYELSERITTEGSGEQENSENTVDDDNDQDKYFNSFFIKNPSVSKVKISFFEKQEITYSFNPDIHLPPPESDHTSASLES